MTCPVLPNRQSFDIGKARSQSAREIHDAGLGRKGPDDVVGYQRSRRPSRRQGLGLLQDVLDGGILKVRWITISPQDALHEDAYTRPSGFTVSPVNRDVATSVERLSLGSQPD